MSKPICQSCGMPMDAVQYSTDKDGSQNTTYCSYCYRDGEFTKNLTMDEMIDHNIQYLDEFNKDSKVKYNKEEAIAGMRQFFPTLLRWKK